MVTDKEAAPRTHDALADYPHSSFDTLPAWEQNMHAREAQVAAEYIAHRERDGVPVIGRVCNHSPRLNKCACHGWTCDACNPHKEGAR